MYLLGFYGMLEQDLAYLGGLQLRDSVGFSHDFTEKAFIQGRDSNRRKTRRLQKSGS